jgi:hypothetical protein
MRLKVKYMKRTDIIEKCRMHWKIGKLNKANLTRKDILMITLWAIAISLIMIKAYMLFYLEDPNADRFWCLYATPGLGISDMVILALMSIVVTILLSDVNQIIYGFAGSLISSFIVAVTYASLFIWYVMGAQELFSLHPYDWEWVLWAGFWKMFFVMVPWVIGTTAMGLAIGIIIRGWMMTS